ncbi:T9SS type A sorting domain-containing protein [Fibrella sp. HMF5335]|uniref:T9SS type A sorting domain-containing protein n=1 Tax=Fibrella rubiginis TaxID=2817060 RepID=A0A939GGX2_9BACT|nr:T9SS type A sorting domain-containing protein [Fibrella rubiginis]MBO0936585.1 T9SS type A sorting domain-containing protein [Fibrella rubiginis]
MWVIKFNFTGDVVWKKLLGGSANEWGFGIATATNGDIVVTGIANSGDGDVRGQHGGGDFWVVRLNSSGTMLWQKTLGGSSNEEAFALTTTDDNGLVVVGYTFSNDGDVTSNKGSIDYWVVRLSSTGDIVWQKTLGGSNWDFARAVTKTKQGDFLIAGRTQSHNGDVTGNHGDWDYWVVKLSSSGQLLWQKALGGSTFDEAFGLTTTTDGGCVVSGFTRSIDGDVTGNHGGAFDPNASNAEGTSGREDVWVVKLNSSGELVWQKTYGGTGGDISRGLLATADGGYLLANTTTSTDGDVSGTHGQADFWVVKLGPTPRSAVSPPALEPLSLLAPSYDCQTKTLTFRTKGGDGSPIEFSATGITDWTTSPNQRLETSAITNLDGTPLLLKARQNGQTASYAFNASDNCGGCDFSSGPRNVGTWNGLLVQIRTISGHNVLVTADPNSTTDKYYPRGDNFWGSFALDSGAIALQSCLNAGTTAWGGLTASSFLKAPAGYKQGTEADGAAFFVQAALPQNTCDVSPRHVGTWNGLNVEIRTFANDRHALVTTIPGASNDRYYVRGDNFWNYVTRDGGVDQYRFCLNNGATAWEGLSLPGGIVPPAGYQQGTSPDGAVFFAQSDPALQSICDVSPRHVGTWNGLNVEIRTFANDRHALVTTIPGASNDRYYVRGDNFWTYFTKDGGVDQYRFCLNSGATAWRGLSLPSGIVPPVGYQQGTSPDGAIYFSINGLRAAAAEPALDESSPVYVQPNPAQDVATVIFILRDAGDVQLRLLDLQGRVRQTRTDRGIAGKNERTLVIGSLSTGLYILEVTLEGRRVNRKLVKE